MNEVKALSVELNRKEKQRIAGLTQAGSALLASRTQSLKRKMDFMDLDREAQDRVLGEMMMQCSTDLYTIADIVKLRDREIRSE